MRLSSLTFAILFVLPSHAFACLWDADTLAMERREFPGIHELIVGHFVRHSDAFYEWRIDTHEAIPEAERTPLDYDNLAVALDKLGRHDEAIAIIRQKLERFPDEGRYESEANLGTFLIHAGKLEEGLVHVKRAIEINPDAHFGREIYQQRLVEYLIYKRKHEAGEVLDDDEDPNLPTWSFASFIYAQLSESERDENWQEEAIRGVAGMIRFGNHDSPILLKALGDLLSHRHDGENQLAARAYLRVGEKDKAETVLKFQLDVHLHEVQRHLKAEVAAGERLNARIAEAERKAIENGTDPNVMFDFDGERLTLSQAAPLREPRLQYSEAGSLIPRYRYLIKEYPVIAAAAGLLFLVFLALVWLVSRHIRSFLRNR